jgi:hypothetical protein
MFQCTLDRSADELCAHLAEELQELIIEGPLWGASWPLCPVHQSHPRSPVRGRSPPTQQARRRESVCKERASHSRVQGPWTPESGTPHPGSYPDTRHMAVRPSEPLVRAIRRRRPPAGNSMRREGKVRSSPVERRAALRGGGPRPASVRRSVDEPRPANARITGPKRAGAHHSSVSRCRRASSDHGGVRDIGWRDASPLL